MGYELAMFPLGTVLLPGMALPLRVFEPRFHALLEAVLRTEDACFGSVMIERGSEVGGGDVRTDVGCVARIEQLSRHSDGHSTLLAVGTARIKVIDWLEDDPYPRASVIDWPDEQPGQPLTTESAGELVRTLEPLAREVIDLAVSLGSIGGLDENQLADDPSLRCYQIATASPLGTLDRLNVLRSPDLVNRVDLLRTMLMDQHLILRAAYGQQL